jgi:outer membrane protein OmpA-like peptidoglycan-associated protein
MKKIAILALGLMFSTAVAAQVAVSNVGIEQGDGRVSLSFDVRVDKKAAGGNHKLVITPVLYDRDGGTPVEFSPIVVHSRRTLIMDERNKVTPLPFATLARYGQTVRYTATVDAALAAVVSGQPELRLDMVSAGCCSEQAIPSFAVAPSAVHSAVSGAVERSVAAVPDGPVVVRTVPRVVERPAPRSAYYAGEERPPYAGEERALYAGDELPDGSRMLVDRMLINFAQGSTRLSDFGYSNYRSLGEVAALLNASPEMALRCRIEITGYASPEGGEKRNHYLARGRALVVRDYLMTNVRWLGPSNFDLYNGGENWEGLYRLVEASAMPERRRVLDIIAGVSPWGGHLSGASRKQMLMGMNEGRTWRYMWRCFFPQLRHAVTITVYMPEGTNMNTDK